MNQTAHATDDPRSLIDTCTIRPSSPEPPARLPIGAALLVGAIAWVPALLLTLLEGRTASGVGVPFLKDFAYAVNCWIVVPLLILAPHLARPRMRNAMRHLERANLVPDEERPQFEAARARACRARDSRLMAIVVLAIALGLAVTNLLEPIGPNESVWYRDPAGVFKDWSWSGLWRVGVGFPIYAYLLLSWLRRLGIWSWFLWQLSRLELRVLPTHPDRVGGLAFLQFAQAGFTPFLLAVSIGVSARMGLSVVHFGTPLQSLIPPAIAVVVLEVILVVVPLLAFSGLLTRTRRRGWFAYSALASRYSGAFADRWIGDKTPPDEELLGTGDIQSLADMGGSFEIIEGTRPVLPSPRFMVSMAAACVAPFLPLILTEVPLDEVLKGVAQFLL